MSLNKLPAAVYIRVSLALLFANCCSAQELQITPDHADGIYQIGQKITWNVEWKSPTTAPSTLTYEIKRGGLTSVATGTLDVSNHPTTIESKIEGPGAVLV